MIAALSQSEFPPTLSLTYEECLDYLESIGPTFERPGLERMESFFACQDHPQPQNKIAAVHVGGTNGKGSVTTFIASILEAFGYRTGKFTGPHLKRFNERFVIDGRLISDEDFAKTLTAVREASLRFAREHPEHGALTWFELLMAMSVSYFNAAGVQACVYEVGLGGRFDATNVLQNVLVSVLTNVELDHVHILGDTREKIAFEKAGIIKPAVPLITAVQEPALRVLKERALKLNAPLLAISGAAYDSQFFRDFELTIQDPSGIFSREQLQSIELVERSLREGVIVELGLKGAYQRCNALVAVFAAVNYLVLKEKRSFRQDDLRSLLAGLKKAYWPGRFQILAEPPAILDGAHNGHGALALRRSLDELYPGRKLVFIFACFANKDHEEILQNLLRAGDRVYLPHLSNTRAIRSALELEVLANKLGAKAEVTATFQEASLKGQEFLRENAGAYGERLIITGSFALIKEALPLKADPLN